MAKKAKEYKGWRNCVECKHIVADNGMILKSPFVINEIEFELIGTENRKGGIWKALDTWKADNGQIYRIDRRTMYEKTRYQMIEFGTLKGDCKCIYPFNENGKCIVCGKPIKKKKNELQR